MLIRLIAIRAQSLNATFDSVQQVFRVDQDDPRKGHEPTRKVVSVVSSEFVDRTLDRLWALGRLCATETYSHSIVLGGLELMS